MDYKISLAPICLFTYNRIDETKKTVEALKNNYLASSSEIFIFSDGWKNDNGKQKIIEVRNFLKEVQGFKRIEIIESKTNKGLAKSIIDGVTQVINKYEKVIVLEDDLLTSPNFLNFMNQALLFYKNNDKIFSISGFSMDLPSLKNETKDYYLGYRASSWGWGTWKSNWDNVDWDVKDYRDFLSAKHLVKRFKRGGSDMPRMLKNQMNGKIDSWAIRWCYDQFKKDQLTIFPSISKIQSIGFGDLATHTKKTKRFNTLLDKGDKQDFEFDKSIAINKVLVKEQKDKFSLLRRIMDRF